MQSRTTVRGADDVDVQRELRVLVNFWRRRKGRGVENRGDALFGEVGGHPERVRYVELGVSRKEGLRN